MARFTRPDTGDYATVIIDAGFEDDGEALVETRSALVQGKTVDLAILTRTRTPTTSVEWGYGPGARCWYSLRAQTGRPRGSSLPAADVGEELIELAEGRGTSIQEFFTGDTAFGGALTILGPDEDWYAELVAQQVGEALARAARRPPSRVARV